MNLCGKIIWEAHRATLAPFRLALFAHSTSPQTATSNFNGKVAGCKAGCLSVSALKYSLVRLLSRRTFSFSYHHHHVRRHTQRPSGTGQNSLLKHLSTSVDFRSTWSSALLYRRVFPKQIRPYRTGKTLQPRSQCIARRRLYPLRYPLSSSALESQGVASLTICFRNHRRPLFSCSRRVQRAVVRQAATVDIRSALPIDHFSVT
jgi:hypothetical protein